MSPRWRYGRASNRIMERVTLTWDGTKYVTAEKQWLDDSGYHCGRDDALIASGDMDRASRELTFSPGGGLQAYLEAHAPGPEKNSRRWAWPRFYLQQQRFYVNALAEAGAVSDDMASLVLQITTGC